MKQPPDKGSAHGSRWGLRPYPPVIGFMAGWHWQKCGFQFAFILQTAQNLVSWFSGKNCCHQMSDFKTKMHQIRFRLGLRPRPRWGNIQCSPDISHFPRHLHLGAVLLMGGKWDGMGGKGNRGGKGKEGRGRGLSLPKVNFLVTSLLGSVNISCTEKAKTLGVGRRWILVTPPLHILDGDLSPSVWDRCPCIQYLIKHSLGKWVTDRSQSFLVIQCPLEVVKSVHWDF